MRNSAQARAGSNYTFLTQKERDMETGLDYFLARYYSSTQGRFTSPDEFAGGPDQVGVLGSGASEKQALPYAEITNPQSLNKYQYSFNNPLNYTDADGHEPQDPPKPGVIQQTIDNINSVFAALWRNFERQKDQIPEDDPRRGPGIGDKQIQVYMDEKGKAMQRAIDVLSYADYTGIAGTVHGVQTGNKREVAFGMVGMALHFRGAGVALNHFEKHGAEFGFKNAVQYVKAASGFASSRGDDVARYVNGAGKVLVYNKATNEFATHTGKIIHTYFKPLRGFDYVRDVIKRDGYKLIQ